MSGGFEYNLTTQSQYEEMKQRNYQLQEENQSLKQSLEQLIKINNQLTDSMEYFNNSALNNASNSNRSPELEHKIEQLLSEIDYYKNLVYTNQDKNQIIAALQGLIESFNQTQKLYEQEISNICQQLDHYKSEWETKLQNYDHTYLNKLKNVDELITKLRKKQEMIAIIEKKINEGGSLKAQQSNTWNYGKNNSTNTNGRVKKKFSQLDGIRLFEDDQKLDNIETLSEKKPPEIKNNTRTSNILKKSQIVAYQKQIDNLKQNQSKLMKQINQKSRMIKVYLQMIGKLKKKLLEKF